MQPKVVADAFKKLIQICSKNNVLCYKQLESNKSSVYYGPLGSLLKKNIFNEWLCSHLNNNEVNVFPLEISNPREIFHVSSATSDQSSYSVIPDILNDYDTVCSLGHTLPVGFAVYGPCVNKDIKENNNFTILSGVDMLSNLQAWTHLSVIFFCPIKNSMNWFYHWSKQRYLWWRKYSSIPSKFSMSDMTTSPSGDHHLSITLEFPWGKHHLETVTLHTAYQAEIPWNKLHIHDDTVDNKRAAPAVLTCETELDLAVLAYLANSFSEKWRSGETKKIFHLHYKLAPYKVCLFLEERDAESSKKLKTVAAHLTKELKDTGISVFPSSELVQSDSISSRFDRLDEMGLPYTIVLNENSIQTGIAGLRNRDTTLQEQVHITELTSKLVKYLKIRI